MLLLSRELHTDLTPFTKFFEKRRVRRAAIYNENNDTLLGRAWHQDARKGKERDEIASLTVTILWEAWKGFARFSFHVAGSE